MKLRRFRMKGKNDPDEFFAWCARKGLSREDLMLILASVELDTSMVIMPRRGGAQQPREEVILWKSHVLKFSCPAT